LILDILQKQTHNNWLVNHNNTQFYTQVEQFIAQLQQIWRHPIPPKILLTENNPYRFLTILFACIALDYPIFLGNPSWSHREYQQVEQLVQPNLIWDTTEAKFILTSYPLEPCIGKIMIPTGGSSGQIRFAMHNWCTLSASVTGFVEYFQEKSINSCCLLPLYHVSGLMQCWRSLLTGGKLLILSYPDLKKHIKPEFNTQDYFLSLVPTQLQFLLESNSFWLSQFKTILLGGAPSWQNLLNQARGSQIPLALSYGMTETAAMIAALKPQEFLDGNNTMGRVLPHAHIDIVDAEGQTLNSGQTGIIGIQTPSLCLGYYPTAFAQGFLFLSNDLGCFNTEGYLTILGRRNRMIITGGEKVYCEEIEAIIKNTGLVHDVCIIGLLDNYWGEVVIAVYVSPIPNQGHQIIAQQVERKLSNHKHPKYWLEIDSLPRNSQGKINYQELKEWAIKQLQLV